MKKSLILISAFAVLGTGFFSVSAVAASFEYSPPLEVGFSNNNTHDLKFRGFEQDKLEERNARVSCVTPCNDLNRSLFYLLQNQTMTNLPLVTGTSEVVKSSSIYNQSVSISQESIVNEAVDSAQ